jgi:hypothetical protein
VCSAERWPKRERERVACSHLHKQVQVFVLQNGYTDLRLQIAVSLAGAQVGYSAVRSTHNRRVVKEGGHKGCVSLSHEILPSK